MKKSSIRKTAVGTIALIVFCVILAGCGAKQQDKEQMTEAKAELTQRQKDILKAEGLSEDFEELEDQQKKAIRAIEEMLSEIEQKYSTKFLYLGYIEPGVLEDEQLKCYEEGTDSSAVITVTRTLENGQYQYKDDCLCVRFVPQYEEALSEVVGSRLKEGSYKIVSDISELYEDKPDADALEKAAGNSHVVIDGAEYSKEDIEGIVSPVFADLNEKEITRSMFRLYLVSHDTFNHAKRGTLNELLDQDGFIFRAVQEFNADGKERITYRDDSESK